MVEFVNKCESWELVISVFLQHANLLNCTEHFMLGVLKSTEYVTTSTTMLELFSCIFVLLTLANGTTSNIICLTYQLCVHGYHRLSCDTVCIEFF